MQNDRTTLRDLSFLSADGVFGLIDHTITQMGKDALRKMVLSPPDSYEELTALQDVVRFFADNDDIFPVVISNGTLVMLEKFFEAADHHGSPPSGFNLLFNSFFQKILNRGAYTYNQFSVSHISDFLKGCSELAQLLERGDIPSRLKETLSEMKAELDAHRLTQDMIQVHKHTRYKELARLSHLARRELKNPVNRLLQHYARLDAWFSMAKATRIHKWTFPELKPAIPVQFIAEGLFHPLLKTPVAYDIDFSKGKNFLILTGANMSGKTTFMRALGVSALLAHLGMGVPASSFTISFLEGIITNMHVEDNIMLGESYFFAEVQRIKQTAQKLLKPAPHLVLMDELFKGTNVHDAYECTKAVVEGLLKHEQHMMVLSTHLYEVAQQFKEREDIIFAYFVTDMTTGGGYSFSYELKNGISNDRIGYRILQKEGVLDLLQRNASGS